MGCSILLFWAIPTYNFILDHEQIIGQYNCGIARKFLNTPTKHKSDIVAALGHLFMGFLFRYQSSLTGAMFDI